MKVSFAKNNLNVSRKKVMMIMSKIVKTDFHPLMKRNETLEKLWLEDKLFEPRHPQSRNLNLFLN